MHRSTLPLHLAAVAALASSLTPAASAQWSTDPGANTAVRVAASDQGQPLIAETGDGGAWVSWFDGIGSGWDVRLQRLGFDGAGALGAGGVLVADRSFSSTQGYGLDVDVDGNALLAFRDDRLGGTQITFAKVTPAGAMPFGPVGIVLTFTTGFVANPKVAATSDGGAVVAWVEDASVRLQKIDAAGNTLWSPAVTLAPAAGSYATADLRTSGDGVILSIVHQTGGFSSPRHLLAQRFDPAGVGTWGPAPLPIFTAGSLQFGNFPSFTTDGAGGAVFSWYSSSPNLQCFVQRVSQAGAVQWQPGGVEVATDPTAVRVNPSAAHDSASDAVVVAWNELSLAQSQGGISAQRFDAAGARLWGPDGATVVPVSPLEVRLPRVVSSDPDGGALVLWSEIPAFGTDTLHGARIAPAGTIDVPRFDVASTPGSKSRLQVGLSTARFAILAWSDGRSDDGDIYAQAVRFDGTLGASTVGTNDCGPAPTNSSGASGSIGATGSADVGVNDLTLRASGVPPGQFGIFVVSPRTGLMPVGEGILCLGGPIGRYQAAHEIRQAGPGGTFSLPIDLTRIPTPNALVPAVPGDTYFFQAWFRDVTGTGANTSNLTDRLRVEFQ